MKLRNPNVISLRSILILEEKLKKIFQEKYGKKVVVYCSNCDIQWPSCDTVSIVLMGRVLEDFVYTELMPSGKEFEIWCLCESFARRLKSVYNLAENSIQSLNRYELFPMPSKSWKPSIHEADFVYSGRASTLKNFSTIVAYLEKLSKIQEREIKLEVYAPLFKKIDFDYSANGVNIVFQGDRGESWAESVTHLDSKILINMSLDPFDDFNISTAQWQSLGGAVLCPFVGAYKELVGENVCFFDPLKIIAGMKGHFGDVQNWILPNKKGLRFPEIKPTLFSKSAIQELRGEMDSILLERIRKLNTYEFTTDIKELVLYDQLS